MRFVLPAVAALLPVVIAPGITFYFDVTPKLVILLIGVAAALVLWRGDLPLDGRLNRVFFILLGAQAASLAVSTAASLYPALSLNGGNWRRFGLVSQLAMLLLAALVAVDCASHRDRVTWYLKALVLGGVPVALYTVAQYFGWDPFLSQASYHIGDVNLTIVRPPSTMGHASYAATYLLFVVFAGIELFRTRIWRWLAASTAALAIVAMILTGTRAALLGLIAGVVILAFLSPRRPDSSAPHLPDSPPPRLRGRWLAITAAFIVALGAFYFSPAGKGLRDRVNWVSSEPLGGARPFLWRDSLRMSMHHLALGYGPETFLREFPRQESLDLARAFPDFLHESPHNIFLDALIEQGLPGLLILMALCTWGIFAAREALWAAAALIACMIAQFFTSFMMPTAFFFYLTLALLIEPGPMRRFPLARIAACGCAIFLAGYGVRLFIGDHALASTRAALDRGDLAGAIVAHRRVEKWAFAGSSADLYYSRRLVDLIGKSTDFRFKAQGIREAANAAISATKTSEESPNAWYNLAAFLSMTSRPPAVERSLREAIQAAPYWYKPHWVLAQLLAAEHRLGPAQGEAEIAIKCNDKAPELIHTLENIRAAQRH